MTKIINVSQKYVLFLSKDVKCVVVYRTDKWVEVIKRNSKRRAVRPLVEICFCKKIPKMKKMCVLLVSNDTS